MARIRKLFIADSPLPQKSASKLFPEFLLEREHGDAMAEIIATAYRSAGTSYKIMSLYF
ncbi:MAG: hypothetical protein ACFFD4_02995 [Candidatus Odinarchaeota archaeon]